MLTENAPYNKDYTTISNPNVTDAAVFFHNFHLTFCCYLLSPLIVILVFSFDFRRLDKRRVGCFGNLV